MEFNDSRQAATRISPPIWNSGFDDAMEEGYCADPDNLPTTSDDCGVCNADDCFGQTVFTDATEPICSSRNNAKWIHHVFDEYRAICDDPGPGDRCNMLTVTNPPPPGEGEDPVPAQAILRWTIRHKRAGTSRVSHAIDNLTVTLTLIEPLCPMPFADADRDGDVDHEDFGALQACITGTDDPGGTYDESNCQCFDAERDFDVDQADVAAFEACATGPTIPFDDQNPPPGCAP
jgi:hypothetical protein